MAYNGQTYHFATDANNYAIALPDTASSLIKRFSVNCSKFVPFAIRNKATFISAGRCQSTSPAQKVPVSNPSLAPNGCGSATTKAYVPDYRFAACCDGHDTYHSTCARGFSECNNDFHDCMVAVCAKLNLIEAKFRQAAAWWYTAWVSSPEEFESFQEATNEACETCPVEKPKICVKSIMVMTVRSVAATCLAKRIYGKKQRVSHKSLSHQPMGLSIGRSSWTQGCLKIGCMFRKQSSITHSSDQGCFPGASGSIVLPRLGSRQLRRRYGLNYHSMTLFLLGSDMQCIHHDYMQTPQELASFEEHRPRALER